MGGGPIDEPTNDEFGPAIAAIDDLIGRMTDFRTRIKDWSDEMDSYIDNVLPGEYGEKNPIEYRWTDARGESRVVVQAGDFQMPSIGRKKTGNLLGCNWLKGKTCAVLEGYTDADRCWIKVTRYPPTNVSLGALGRWNPFIQGVSKVSKAYYDIDEVGIKAKNL